MGQFHFKQFSISNERSALKVGTDAVILGAAMTLPTAPARMLDIGTGTGVIALLAAQRCPQADIDAIDIDLPSAQEASENFAASPWPQRLRALHQDMKSFDPGSAYDVIFSNPPYYDDSLQNPDKREAAARHSMTLGMQDIMAFASEHLSPEGTLSLILPADAEKRLLRTAASFGLFPFRILRIRTTERKPVKRIVAEFSRSRGSVAEEMLVIMDSGDYSAQYQALTGCYYLRG